MKNLYLQLGIDPQASQDDIEAALQAKPELADAAAILLDESRRAAYNRTVSTLSSIGMLRHRLGLDADQTWFVKTCPDFAPRLHMRKYVAPATPVEESAPAQIAAASGTATQVPVPGSRNNKSWIKAAVILFVMAVVLYLWRVFSE